MGLRNLLKKLFDSNYKLKSQYMDDLLEDIGALIDKTIFDYKIIIRKDWNPEYVDIRIEVKGSEEK